jgi:hypothetical protein
MKALESYRAARILLKEDLVYPSYVMLKEATRSTLAYINEDLQGKDYSEKTKMRTLLEDAPAVLIQNVDMDIFNIFIEMDKKGLDGIMAIEIDDLKKIRRTLKKIMGVYLDADI